MAKVQCEQGWLVGEQLDLCTGDGKYYSFKGIPYAAPPVGKLRFKAPEPPLPWEGERKALEHGPVCPHVDLLTNKIEPGNEDCLYLNVYTSDLTPKEALPVMLFIHGGGYKSGSGNDNNYGPDFLVSNNVVLVTINYRLEALGFLCLDTKDVPGNAGMKDQVAALKWVQKNIKNFGGDPGNVTVFGESAGGASTSLHILSPMSKNLFHRAIPMSGVSFCDWTVPFEPVRRAFRLGEQLGFKTRDPNKLFEFLQSVPVEKLVGVSPYVLPAEEMMTSSLMGINFLPVAEKDFGQERFIENHSTFESLKTNTNEVDVLIGYTSKEGIIALSSAEQMLKIINNYPQALIPRVLSLNSSAGKLLEIGEAVYKHYFGDNYVSPNNLPDFTNFSTEMSFTYPINKFAEDLLKTNSKKKYFYKFSCYSDRNMFGKLGAAYGIEGASHLDDMLYLFDPKALNLKVDKNSKEYKMIQLSCKLFTNFAKFGHPTPDVSLGAIWPEFNSNSRHFGDIGETLTIGNHVDKEAVEFWRKIYAMAGHEA